MTMTTFKKETCPDARTVSLYYGIFKTITSFLSAMASIGGFVYIYFNTSLGLNLDGSFRPRDSSHIFDLSEVTTILYANGLLIVILIFSLLEFACSVVLVYGAWKRKIGHLKVYIIYGIVKILLILLLSVILYVTMWDNIPSSVAFLYCGINTVFCTAVYMAYVKINRFTEEYSKLSNDIPVKNEESKTNLL